MAGFDGASPTTDRFDVVVIGAGTSGASAAGMLAEHGYRVALVEARTFDGAGARWINDIPPWMFDQAGIPRPTPPEKHVHHRPVRMFGEHDRVGLMVPDRPMWGVDNRLLVARLQTEAFSHGVEGFEQTALEEVECRGQRPTTVRLRRTGPGAKTHGLALSADLFVDASGINGALRKRVPALAAACPIPPASDQVSAAQQIREVTDRHGAAAFLERLGAEPDEFLVWSALYGGYSTQVIRLAPDLSHVDLLTGVMSDRDPAGGLRTIEALAASHSWIGDATLTGASLIPVRRPYDRLGMAGAALVGDAGCQTFPAHGSGVGSGLIAARTLAETVRYHPDHGSEAATWAYQAAYMRDRGAVSGAYDVFRRTVQKMSGEQVRRLLDVGLMTAGSTTRALDQKMPRLRPAELYRIAGGALRAPGPASQFGPCVARMFATHALYRRYPEAVDPKALRRWANRVARLSGQPADPT